MTCIYGMLSEAYAILSEAKELQAALSL